MKTIEYSDECSYDENGNTTPILNIFPANIMRSKPKWLWHLTFPFHVDGKADNQKVIEFLSEIYLAIQNDSTRLAVMGIRALIEMVMIAKIGDQGTFKKNIDKFQEKGFLSQLQRDALDVVLEAGHATIHRSFKPKPYQVNAAIDIVENIIEAIYVNEKNQSSINNIPARGT